MDTQTQNATTLPSVGSSSTFMTELQNLLLSQSGAVSSTTSDIESSINQAISGLQSSTESANLALESQFGRESGYLLEQASQNAIAGRAAGSGGLMNMAALRELTSQTDKNLNDLEQRKQELILQNNASAASKIADLQLKALEYRQQAQQKIFDNLLGLGNFGLQVQQEERAQRAQSFQERSAIASIGLQYGVNVTENDTIESVVAKAMPMASKLQQAELSRLNSEIAFNNAKLREIEAGTAETYDPIYAAQALARYETDPSLSEKERSERIMAIKNQIKGTDLIKVYDEQDRMIREAYSPENLKPKYVSQLRSGVSSDVIKNQINSATYLSPAQKKDALKTLEEAKKQSGKANTGINMTSAYQNRALQNLSAFGSGAPVGTTEIVRSLFNFYNR